jgi:Tfp pilus assembly protein PilX
MRWRACQLRECRGFALATVMMVVFVLLVFGLTLADLTTSSYQLSYQSSEQTRAFELAQAGVHEAIADLTTNPAWTVGVPNDSLDASGNFTVTVVNNLEGAGVVSGVPPYTAQIDSYSHVATGRSSHIQALVQFSSFPYAVAGWTGVQADQMTVLGAPNLASVIAGNTSTQGHVYSGGPGPSSLTAAASTMITGRARSVGGVDIANPSTIVQGIDQNIVPEVMPTLDFSSFSTQNSPEVITLLNNGQVVGPMAGAYYCDGNVDLINPVLADAEIYVTGNLNINGPLLGTGSIFVGGTTFISGTSALLSTNGIAVFSQGDLTVVGSPFLFQGVLFTYGNLNLGSGATIIGAALAAQEVLASGPIQVTYVPEYTQFGSYWSQHSMQGSLLAGPTPLLKILSWTQVS